MTNSPDRRPETISPYRNTRQNDAKGRLSFRMLKSRTPFHRNSDVRHTENLKQC